MKLLSIRLCCHLILLDLISLSDLQVIILMFQCFQPDPGAQARMGSQELSS